MNTWKRRALAMLSVPLLALPSAGGVYLWLEPHIGPLLAALTASGFELLYIGINVLIISTPELRRYARNVALSGVATAIIFNTLARYQAMVCPPLSLDQIARGVLSSCTLRTIAFDPLALGLAILESIPLAGLAYAMSVLLHRLSEVRPSIRPRQLRALVKRLARLLRAARVTLAPLEAMLTQARVDLESARAALARQADDLAHAWSEAAQANADSESWQQQAAQNEADAARALRDAETAYARESEALREAARLEAEAAPLRASSARASDLAAQLDQTNTQATRDRREYEQTTAQLREDLALARAASGLDVLAVARRMIKAEIPLREIAPLIGLAESTLRGRLKSATNGHAIETPE